MQRSNTNWSRIATPLSLALVSLFAALGLWVAVTESESPSRTGFFSGAIVVTPVNVPEGLAVASLSSNTVSIRIRADETTFSKLTTADFRADVDLAGARQGSSDHVVLASVVSRHDVEIVDVSPPILTAALEQETSKQVAVQPNLIGSPAQGFSVPPDGVDSSPATVRVTGATSLVQRVAYASADVNLTALRLSLQQQYTLLPRDNRGADLRGLSIDPPNVDIRVNIVQQEVTLGLTVVPQTQGSVAEGYNLVAATPDPPLIPVSGPLELLQAASFITTEAIDLTGIRADATRTVRLRLPAGLQATQNSVLVRLKVQPAPASWTVAVAPQVTNLGEGLKYTLQTQTVNLRLSGDMPSAKSFQPGSARLTVDLNGLGEGIHVLKPNIVVPEGVELVSADPAQVVVVVSR